jgi:DNA-binding response OmpR family regulator
MRLRDEWKICPYCAAPATRVEGASSRAVPQAAAAQVAAPPPVAAPAAEPRQYRALVVDDHADIRRLVTFTLEHSGLPISTVTASNGPEALELAQAEPPDLILLDIMMPGMDGFQVCERLRSNLRTAFIPIIMLTARDDAASRAQGFLAGTDDYVGKPFARAELLARVRRLLERSYGTVLPQPPGAAAPAEGPSKTAPQDVMLQ